MDYFFFLCLLRANHRHKHIKLEAQVCDYCWYLPLLEYRRDFL